MQTQELVQQNQFIQEFSKKVNDNVSSLELCELRGSSAIYKEMNIYPQNGQINLWGLLIFCEHSFYFYAPKSENFFSALFRKSANAPEPQEQLLNMKSLKDFKVKSRSTNFFSFLNPENKRTLDTSISNINGQSLYFSLVFNKRATEIENKINLFLNKTE